MALLIANCPRCRASKITFDPMSAIFLYTRYDWQNWFEVFCKCRHCKQSTVFILNTKNIDFRSVILSDIDLKARDLTLNHQFSIEGYVNLKNFSANPPPDFLAKDIDDAFREGATCLAVGCYNAAGTMFRLCVDLATRSLLPKQDSDIDPQPNSRQRRDLGLRLQWLFDNDLLPESLRELAKAIREDANDGAHAGLLVKADAEDLLDFTFALLDRLISEPKRLAQAEERRRVRRSPPEPNQ